VRFVPHKFLLRHDDTPFAKKKDKGYLMISFATASETGA
jgi:hypothetical protein